MNYDFFEYQGRKYVCRSLYFPKFKNNFVVSCEALEKVLINEEGGYDTLEAQYIDEQIFYYLPDDLIFCSEKEIIKYVEDEIE